MTVQLDLSGAIALVTGAGRGIGRDIALALAAAGADVAVNDFADEAACAAAVAEIEGLGRKGLVVMADVADEGQVNAMVERAESELGPLSIVVNNAGITRDNVVMMMDPGDFDAVIATHLRGTFLVSKAAARRMFRRRAGCIINLSSVVGRRGQRRPGELRRRQGRHHRPHEVAGQGARRTRRTRQRDRSRLHRHAHDTGSAGGGTQADRRQHAAALHRRDGGRRECGRVSRLAAGTVHHRRDPAGRRRARHLTPAACRTVPTGIWASVRGVAVREDEAE